MGSNSSKQIIDTGRIDSTDSSVINEKVDYTGAQQDLSQELRGLKLKDTSTENTISVDSLSKWETDLLADPKNKLAQNAFVNNDITSVIAESSIRTKLKDQYFFNVEVKTIGSTSYFNDQASSGRCWLFATSNVLRTHVIKNYNLKEDSFQLSQGYLFFYDKLEKANFFLENIIDTADEPLDSRLVQYLLRAPVNDGGQWDMVINLVNKYGVVPHEIFPDSAQAKSSSRLNYIVTEKLREYALILRGLVKKGVPKPTIYSTKNSMNKEIYNIISLSLGTPPKPNDSFTWEFIDKDGNYKYFSSDPKDFYKNHVRFNAAKHFSLIHDPRNPYQKLYTVDRLNNIHGGKPIEYVNTILSDIKQVVIKMLKDNEPVFFGSDVGKFYDRGTGILDTNAYDYELGFGTGFNINKEERLKTGSSAMTHAMVITGVHLDPTSGNPVRWKIENSWGDVVGDKGFFLMTDEWFDEYVFQIVTNKKYVDKKTFDIWNAKDFTILPFYDPMGALA